MSKSTLVKLVEPGLTKKTNDFLNNLAFSSDKNQTDSFVEEMQQFLAKIEKRLEKKGCGYEAFSGSQQKLFLRIKNYCLPLYGELFLKNCNDIKNLIELSSFGCKIKSISYSASSRTLWKLKPLRFNKYNIIISDLFLAVDDVAQIKELIVHIASKVGRRLKVAMPHPVKSESCKAFIMNIERGVIHKQTSGEGSYYNLNEIFAELNKIWFQGKLQSNGLYWTPRDSKRRTGYYKASSREIFISRNFDTPKVPGFVVEFVMYHEMLHMEQGDCLLRKGKRAHDAEFRRREQLHPMQLKADKFLRKFARS